MISSFSLFKRCYDIEFNGFTWLRICFWIFLIFKWAGRNVRCFLCATLSNIHSHDLNPHCTSRIEEMQPSYWLPFGNKLKFTSHDQWPLQEVVGWAVPRHGHSSLRMKPSATQMSTFDRVALLSCRSVRERSTTQEIVPCGELPLEQLAHFLCRIGACLKQ